MRFKLLLPSSELTVTEDLGEGIVVCYRLAPRRGSLAVAGIEITTADDGQPVTARVLRKLSPAKAALEGLAGLRGLDVNSRGQGRGWGRMMEAMTQGVPWSDSALWRRVATADKVQRFTREERLALVALAYVVSLDANDTRVNVAIAKRFGIETAQARELVRAARYAELLTSAQGDTGNERRGRAEGELTPKAVKLLTSMYTTWPGTNGEVITVLPEAPEDDE